MSKRLLKQFNNRAGNTSCPAFFIKKIDHFSRFSDDTKKDRKTRKTQNKQKGNKMKLTKKELETLNEATIIAMELLGAGLVDEETLESVCSGLNVKPESFTQAREIVARLMREQNER